MMTVLDGYATMFNFQGYTRWPPHPPMDPEQRPNRPNRPIRHRGTDGTLGTVFPCKGANWELLVTSMIQNVAVVGSGMSRQRP